MDLFITVEQLVRGTRFEAGTTRSAIRLLWFPPSWIMVRDREVLLDERIANLLRIAELLVGDDRPDLRLVHYAARMEVARRQKLFSTLTDAEEKHCNLDHINFLSEISGWGCPLPNQVGTSDTDFDSGI
jgi:hypothetical protein